METKTIAFSEFYLKDISLGEIGDKLTSADFDELQSAYKKGEKYSVEKGLLKDIQIEMHEDFIWLILKQGKARQRHIARRCLTINCVNTKKNQEKNIK